MLDGEEWELRVSDTRVPHSDSSDSFRDSEVLRVADTRVPHIIHPGDFELRVTDTRVPYNIFQRDLSITGQSSLYIEAARLKNLELGVLVG